MNFENTLNAGNVLMALLFGILLLGLSKLLSEFFVDAFDLNPKIRGKIAMVIFAVLTGVFITLSVQQ